MLPLPFSFMILSMFELSTPTVDHLVMILLETFLPKVVLSLVVGPSDTLKTSIYHSLIHQRDYYLCACH